MSPNTLGTDPVHVMERTDSERSGSAKPAATTALSDRELCDRFEVIPTAAINDVLRSKGLIQQVLPPSVEGLEPSMRVAGIAFTIKGSKNLQLANEMEERAAMLEAIPQDAVCVWDTSNDDESAQWGEVMTMAAQRQGCRGAIVDGGVRDTDKILELDFPVFCRYRTSNGMLGRFRMSAWQVPVRIGQVTIHPGDITVGDIDGVIIVPRALAEETLVEAERIQFDEISLKKMITDGIAPREVVERGGYF
ncbi:RraA family protein [Paenarthrobacter sp. OM7]|uniref:Putative 4-hydroxy-4-methyl-2-oxoglutarate aldolase n=1 Tax=Paenarthrobacter sp. AMU7 TaxID=3162492 RepID=A0AB39YRV0_9MICC|nr:RraA family protein [Paenarthrobacter sp. OM7]WGM20265.1 RraA family protein [Paenarthrobacter sp. OM7]